MCVTFVNFLTKLFPALLGRYWSSSEWCGRPGKQGLMGQQHGQQNEYFK